MEQTTLDNELVFDDQGVFRLRQRATTATYGGVDVITVEEYELGLRRRPAVSAGARIVGWNDGLTSPEAYTFDAKSNLRAMGRYELHLQRRRQPAARRGARRAERRELRLGRRRLRDGAERRADRMERRGRLLAHGADTLAWDGLGRLRAAQVAGQRRVSSSAGACRRTPPARRSPWISVRCSSRSAARIAIAISTSAAT